VPPVGQYEPEDAAHGWHASGEVAPCVALQYPAGQRTGIAEPGGQCVPAGHTLHALASTAPTVIEYVPSSQGVGVDEPAGQKKPAGQVMDAPDAEQYSPAAHALHSIFRIACDGAPSATYTFPDISTATPKGWLNFALMPMPSMNPFSPPAIVETAKLDEIRRIV
jgi:hypothetical protein